MSGLLGPEMEKRADTADISVLFLGPRGPLRIPSFVRSSVFPQEKSKSQLKPYRSSQDHVRPFI